MQSLGMFFPLIIIGGMLFFMTRTQKKQQNERKQLLDSMAIGDKVVTIGGLHGIVSEFNQEDGNNTVILDCEGIFLEFNRATIAQVTPGTHEPEVVEEVSVTEVDETSNEE